MKKPTIFPILWIMFFDHVCINITFPVLTLLFFDIHTSLFPADTSQSVRSMWYGWCVAIPHIVNISVILFLSALSDAYGRKRLLLIGTLGALLFAITAALGVLWGMLSLLFLGRFIQGAFSRTNPIAQAVIGDMAPKEKKVLYMGYLQTAISMGAFIGPVIGGYFANQFFFAELNFSLPFFLAGIFALMAFFITWYTFDETHTERHLHKKEEFKFSRIKTVFSEPSVWRISLILLLSQITWSTYYQFIPPVLKTALNFDAHALGLFVGLVAFWLASATSVGLRLLSPFFSTKHLLIGSLYLVLLGSVSSFIFCSLHLHGAWSSLVWIAAIPTAVGDVMAYSCLTAMYSNVVSRAEQGKVMGICLTVVAIIWALTAILGGFLMSFNTFLPLLVAPIGIVLAIFLMHSSFSKKIVF